MKAIHIKLKVYFSQIEQLAMIFNSSKNYYPKVQKAVKFLLKNNWNFYLKVFNGLSQKYLKIKMIWSVQKKGDLWSQQFYIFI